MITEYLKRLKNKRLSPKTIALYALELKTLERLGGDPKTIEDHLAKCAPATHSRKLTMWRAYLHSIGDHSLDELPNPKVNKKSYVFLQENEAKLLLSQELEPSAKMFIEISLSLGLRISEVLQIDSTRVDGDWVRITRKGGGEQMIPLTQALRTKLQSFEGFKFTPNFYRKQLARACKLAGISKRITPHKLRHTFATQAMSKGWNVTELQEILGHSSLVTTARYVHVTPDNLLKLIRGNE